MESPTRGNECTSVSVLLVVPSNDIIVCVCVVIPFILDVRLVDVPARVTQEKGHTGFLHLLSAVLALIIYREKDSTLPFPRRLVEYIEFCVLTSESFSTCWVRKNPSSCGRM